MLETIRTEMNSGSPAEGNDDIEGLHYHGETMLNDSSKNFGDNTAGSVIQPIASASLSGVGISLITVGSVIALLFVFAASRRKESHRTRQMKEIIEEDLDCSPKCHPEIAGEGIEYAWALSKFFIGDHPYVKNELKPSSGSW